MKNLYYYKREEAELIRQTYSSWIGKHAHVGKGKKSILYCITIRPKRDQKEVKENQKIFSVEFEFEEKKKFSAIEFFFHNSLLNISNFPYVLVGKKNNAA